MSKISAYIIAYNEEDKITSCIKSVHWADEVILIDSFSTDRTVEIATSLGARVVQVEFKGFGDLRNRALEACQHEWVFSLDSDEFCTSEVRDEIQSLIQSNQQDVFYVPRRNYFLGQEIKHSGWYPNYRQPQLFKKSHFQYDNSPVHEGFTVAPGSKIGHLHNAIWQLPFKNLSESIAKMNRYSSLGATKSRQANSTYAKAFTHACWAFIKHYFFKKGFLDKWAGFFIAFSYFEVTLYRYAKSVENQELSTWKTQWDAMTIGNLPKDE